MLLPGKLIVNRTRSARSSAAHRTLCEIRSDVYMQGLTGDKPRILGCQKHRGLGDLVRVRHAAGIERAISTISASLLP